MRVLMSIIQENMGRLCVSDMYSAIIIQEEVVKPTTIHLVLTSVAEQ